MSNPILLVFCSPADRERVTRVLPEANLSGYAFIAHGMFAAGGASWQDRALGDPGILLAIGAEGGASLAMWVEQHGLDSVTGIGLVGVTAPWAEREQCRCEGKALFGPCPHDRIPLGPLEPLRAVAERALDGNCDGYLPAPGAVNSYTCVRCGDLLAMHTIHEPGSVLWSKPTCPVVIACAPDDGVCSTCGDCHGYRPVAMVGSESLAGLHIRPEEVPRYVHLEPSRCVVCFGTGKALSSAEVARELGGWDCPPDGKLTGVTWERTGIVTLAYPTRAALADHGLRAVIERLTR